VSGRQRKERVAQVGICSTRWFTSLTAFETSPIGHDAIRQGPISARGGGRCNGATTICELASGRVDLLNPGKGRPRDSHPSSPACLSSVLSKERQGLKARSSSVGPALSRLRQLYGVFFSGKLSYQIRDCATRCRVATGVAHRSQFDFEWLFVSPSVLRATFGMGIAEIPGDGARPSSAPMKYVSQRSRRSAGQNSPGAE
jgi:hypothetical protein